MPNLVNASRRSESDRQDTFCIYSDRGRIWQACGRLLQKHDNGSLVNQKSIGRKSRATKSDRFSHLFLQHLSHLSLFLCLHKPIQHFLDTVRRVRAPKKKKKKKTKEKEVGFLNFFRLHIDAETKTVSLFSRRHAGNGSESNDGQPFA